MSSDTPAVDVVPAVAATEGTPNPEDTKAQVAKLVAEGKKAIALKQWEEGVAKYGEALDLQREIVDEFDITMAPLLLSYGRALYELALSQQGVMGKEEVAKGTDPATQLETEAAESSKGKFVFEGDGDDDDEDDEDEEGEGEGEQGAADGEDEPEDDFNAAWEILDVARTIYAREVETLPATEGREQRLLLSECHLSLGDVSCETENFPQAVQDYTAALDIKKALLPASSRALASAHYQLGTVLEFTPAGRKAALEHVQAALDGFKLRAADITAADAGKADEVKSEDVARMTSKEREAESRDVAALIGDLEVKIEELNSAPEPADFVAESINHLLGGAPAAGSSAAAVDSRPVNDLTSMVRKKAPKKPTAAAPPAAANGAEKRKADDEAGAADKKAKAD